MHETAAVEMREPGRDPLGHAPRLVWRQRFRAETIFERPSRQPLERDERPGLSLAVVVDARHVLVRQRRGGLRLAPEAAEVGGRGENLERDRAIERAVVRAPDLRHRPAALQLFEPVAAGDLISLIHDYYGMPDGFTAHPRRGAGADPGSCAAASGRACPDRRGRRADPRGGRASEGRPPAVRQLGDGRLRGARIRSAGDAADRGRVGCRPAVRGNGRAWLRCRDLDRRRRAGRCGRRCPD